MVIVVPSLNGEVVGIPSFDIVGVGFVVVFMNFDFFGSLPIDLLMKTCGGKDWSFFKCLGKGVRRSKSVQM